MRIIKVKDEQFWLNGNNTYIVYNCIDFPYYKFSAINNVCNKKDIVYYNIPAAFDIETTTIANVDVPYGFMYLWQVCILDYRYVCMGRTWEEFNIFINNLVDAMHLHIKSRLVFYVHNLGFESQFLRNFLDVHDVFAVKERVPLKIVYDCGIEMRCSYKLSNMSLSKFCKSRKNVFFTKQSGDDYDYSKIRTATTELDDDEIFYGFCDVVGLTECIRDCLTEDNIVTIPLTSTGYVRRDAKTYLRRNAQQNRKYFTSTYITPEIYDFLSDVKRGGNVHCNPLFSGTILDCVGSFDKKSSYPYEMLTKKYPMRFLPESGQVDVDDIISKDLAVVFDLILFDVRLIRHTTIPYIPFAKCKVAKNAITENGRVTRASMVVIRVTEIDYKIIVNQYTFNDLNIGMVYVAEKDFLPKDYRDYVIDLFIKKEQLNPDNFADDVELDKYFYMKSKNRLNALFGMMMTDITHSKYEYSNIGEAYKKIKLVTYDDKKTAIDKYYKHYDSFAVYQQGIYVTAYARESLQMGIDIVGRDCVYTDTDCVKFIGNHDKDFDLLNSKIYDDADNYDVKPYCIVNNKKIYLGYWAKEHTYDKFCSCGAKKYADIINDKFEITVSGANKKCAAKYLEDMCIGINAFDMHYRNGEKVEIPPYYFINKDGKEIRCKGSGRTVSYYNDVDNQYYITINGCKMLTGSNIGVVNTTYSLGTKPEYDEFLIEYQSEEYDDLMLGLDNDYI